jgi:hypothetical protein
MSLIRRENTLESTPVLATVSSVHWPFAQIFGSCGSVTIRGGREGWREQRGLNGVLLLVHKSRPVQTLFTPNKISHLFAKKDI